MIKQNKNTYIYKVEMFINSTNEHFIHGILEDMDAYNYSVQKVGIHREVE